MSTTDAGRIAEIKVMAHLAWCGWYPFIDPSGKCPVDILAWRIDGLGNEEVARFQVKSTSTMTGSGKWRVEIGTVRPNRTGNKITKFDPNTQDWLMVYIAPLDKVLWIESKTITAGRCITVNAADEILEITS